MWCICQGLLGYIAFCGHKGLCTTTCWLHQIIELAANYLVYSHVFLVKLYPHFPMLGLSDNRLPHSIEWFKILQIPNSVIAFFWFVQTNQKHPPDSLPLRNFNYPTHPPNQHPNYLQFANYMGLNSTHMFQVWYS